MIRALQVASDRTAADDLADVVRQLGAFVPVDRIPQWLLAPREGGGGRTPVHLVAAGQLRDVYALIRTDCRHPDGISPDGLAVSGATTP